MACYTRRPMANVSIARRYARALLDVAAESGTVDEVLKQLDALGRVVHQSAELRGLLSDPAYTRTQRQAVMDQVMAALGKTDPALSNLVKVLLDRNRAASLPDIARLYRDRADALAGRVRGRV